MIKTLALAVAAIGMLVAQGPPNPPAFVKLHSDFHDVAIHSDGQRAWAAGDSGSVFRSTNSGSTWTQKVTSIEGTLFAITFHEDGRRGWAVGRGGIVYTNDGGDTWSQATLAENSTLFDVTFDREGTRGFAVGARGVILASKDGGLTWAKVDAGAMDNRLLSVAFDAGFRVGLIGGDETLLRSEDGGKSWTKQADPLSAMSRFVSVTTVWLSADGKESAVLAGRDRGSYWSRHRGTAAGWTTVPGPEINMPRAVFRPDNAVAAGRAGVFFAQGPGGKPIRLLEGTYRSVAFARDTGKGLAVGDFGRVARTEDGGKTWRVIHEWKAHKFRKITLQLHPERIWTVGTSVLRSEDGGVSFHEQIVPNLPKGDDSSGASDIVFSPDGRLGWLTTTEGGILRTTNGGQSWSPSEISSAINEEVTGISFDRRGSRGLAAAGPGGLWMTADGGVRWTRVALDQKVYHVAMAADGVHALAAGPGGTILRSEDGGVKWRAVPSGTKYNLYSLKARPDGRVAWVGGDGGTLLRTENGGRTWSPVTINSEDRIHGVVDLWFDTGGQHGWAVAQGGEYDSMLLRSVDAGRNWEALDSAPASYKRIAFSPDGVRGWAVGDHGILVTARPTHVPVIRKFEVTSPDFLLDLQIEDADTTQYALQATIEVEGRGLELVQAEVRRRFRATESEGVEWPKTLFHEGQIYTFRLRVTDGWNIVTREFRYGSTAPAPVSKVKPPIPVDIPELRGTDPGTVRVLLDGQAIEAAQLITRGSDGNVKLTPSEGVFRKLSDGFHTLTVAGGTGSVTRRIGLYKEEFSLKLFRPYRSSYALVIAIGEYPPDSGYRKLPSAVPQARELEKTLRAQGFTVLPPLYDRNATRAQIETAIRTAPAGPEDRLLVYFGGHGDDEKGFQNKEVGYLVPYDGRKADLWGTAIPLEKIGGEYSTRLRAKHVLFALDSCQSGLAVSRGGAVDPQSAEMKRFKALADIEGLTREPGRTILAAGTGGQDALDISGGIFTTALTDAIRGAADVDRNGVVDYFELFAYVWGRVNAEARAWTRKQQPSDNQLGNGRWVFVHERTIL
ncbi:MAG: YCF48-related protein [Bryobacteraceae bacterium]